jgi:ATP-dependent Lon protease
VKQFLNDEKFVFFIYYNTGTFCSIFSLPALKTHPIRALIARELKLHCTNFHNKNSFYQFKNDSNNKKASQNHSSFLMHAILYLLVDNFLEYLNICSIYFLQ